MSPNEQITAVLDCHRSLIVAFKTIAACPHCIPCAELARVSLTIIEYVEELDKRLANIQSEHPKID